MLELRKAPKILTDSCVISSRKSRNLLLFWGQNYLIKHISIRGAVDCLYLLFYTLIGGMPFFRKNPELYGELAKGQKPKVCNPISDVKDFIYLFYLFKKLHSCHFRKQSKKLIVFDLLLFMLRGLINVYH